MEFRTITPEELMENPFTAIGKDWMLVTTGDESRCNTMTASWGQMGVMWNKPVVNVYIRPQRFTHGLMEQHDRFSLNFFEPGTRRQELTLLGTKSGRDGDKIGEAGLTTRLFDGVPAIAESRLVLVCKKLYAQNLSPEAFLDTRQVELHYKAADYHRQYIAEIEKVYTR